MGELLRAESVTKRFSATAEPALANVSLTIEEGARIAVVGESGSGKSTLLNLLVGIERASAGEVYYRGEALRQPQTLQKLRHRSGIVFQDPQSMFHPHRAVGLSVLEPLEAAAGFGGFALSAAARKRRRDFFEHGREITHALFERLDLPADSFNRTIESFSGGQRQRLAIARAIAHTPEILFADEPVSAADLITRKRTLDLLSEIHRDLGITLFTVTHDIASVPRIADRVIVLYRGKIVEDAATERIFASPQHPYTHRLLRAFAI